MSQFSDYAKALLAGGLPAVLDYGQTASPSATGDTRPERTAPTGTKQDEEPFLSRVTDSLTGGNIAVGALGLVAAVGVIWLIVRAVR